MSLQIDLPAEVELRLRENAERRGLDLQAYVGEMLAAAAQEGAAGTGETASPLLSLFQDAWARIPAEEREALPSDLSSHHDDYIRDGIRPTR